MLIGFYYRIAGHPLAQNEKCLHMFLQDPVIGIHQINTIYIFYKHLFVFIKNIYFFQIKIMFLGK